jgi:hypothetical protein
MLIALNALVRPLATVHARDTGHRCKGAEIEGPQLLKQAARAQRGIREVGPAVWVEVVGICAHCDARPLALDDAKGIAQVERDEPHRAPEFTNTDTLEEPRRVLAAV